MRSEDRKAAAERLVAAVFASAVAHALFFLLTPKQKIPDPMGPIVDLPLNVVIAPPQPEPVAPAPPSVPATAPAKPPPRIDRPPTPLPPRFPPAPVPRPDAPREPLPPPPPPEPAVDMMAMIEQRRAQRRAAEAAMARGAPSMAKPDAAEKNLATLSGREGVGGVFQVLEKGIRRGTFAFNGFRNEGRRQWREVIEVDAGPGGDIEIAMIRRMIELIRTHYSGDFQWESHRLGRVVVLSARPEDQAGLEEFLMKEFFGAPAAPPRR